MTDFHSPRPGIAQAIVLLAVAVHAPSFAQSGSECAVTYYAFGGHTDSGDSISPEGLEGATLYFLDIDNWPGKEKLASLNFAGGGIVSKAQFQGGKAIVKFPEGRHKVTIVADQKSKRYWAIHDKKALPFYTNLHEFYCSSGKIGPRR